MANPFFVGLFVAAVFAALYFLSRLVGFDWRRYREQVRRRKAARR
jgi:hypothetical protein